MMSIIDCNKELKNLFPNSKLKVVDLKNPEEQIDICGELSTVDFFTFMFFKDAWIKKNLGKLIRGNYREFILDPGIKRLKAMLKIATTDIVAKKINPCLNISHCNPDLYSDWRNTTPENIFLMGVYITFNAMVSRYEKLLKKENIPTKAEEKHYRYTAVITSESEGQPLGHISEHPWEGILEKIIKFDTMDEFWTYDVEGLFYQLYENENGKRLGYGSINCDFPAMDIRRYEEKSSAKKDCLGQLIIISGFSRAGKDAIADGLKEMSDNYIYSISATTRQPRLGERNEVDYYFVTPECFAEIENSGGFLESAEYCGNHYGTLLTPVAEALKNGRDMVLVLEKEGAMKVKQLYPSAITFFVAAPAADLKKRMKDSDMSEEDCKKRIAEIQKEILVIPKYDYLIMNGNGKLEKNIELVHNIIKGQKSKTSENLEAIERLKKEYC